MVPLMAMRLVDLDAKAIAAWLGKEAAQGTIVFICAWWQNNS